MRILIVALIAIFSATHSAAHAGPLRTLTKIYVGAKVAQGGLRLGRSAAAVRARAGLVRAAVRDVERVTGQKVTRERFAYVRRCLQAPVDCLDTANKTNWPSMKEGAIKAWERTNSKPWPRYTTNVPNPAGGKALAQAGGRLDAHHAIPKAQGGPHEPWNLFPAPRPGHQSVIHR